MNKKIKVAMVTNHFGITGISTVILNYCKALKSQKYDFSIIVGDPVAEENRKECSENGICLVELPSRHKKSVQHYYRLWKTLRDNQYDIVHVHGSSSMMAIELTIAKFAGGKIRFAHSHNSMCPNMKLQKLLNPYFKKIYTKSLACGKLAGDWLFGENQFEILPNGFRTEQFVFEPEKRCGVRKQLNIEGKFVIGHIGRFNEQKNQLYLIQIFEEIVKQREDAVLLLVGTGPDFEKTKSVVEKSKYRKNIILYGVTEKTSELYAAMDVFVLPSRHEGLPVVLLEAQISGLPCIVSDKVTREVDFGEIEWLSIDEKPEKWANVVMKTEIKPEEYRKQYRKNHISIIEKYDIVHTAKQLDEIYDKAVHL